MTQSNRPRPRRPSVHWPCIKKESDAEEDVQSPPHIRPRAPDLSWIPKWEGLDIKSAIKSQIEFFLSAPSFELSKTEYVFFFTAIRTTIIAATNLPSPITADDSATHDLLTLTKFFEGFVEQCESLLRNDLSRIKESCHDQYSTIKDFETAFDHHSVFLSRAKVLALHLDLWKEWEAVEDQLRAAKQCWLVAAEQDLFSQHDSSMAGDRLPKPKLSMDGPLSPKLLEMDLKFSDEVWGQWIEGCTAYFNAWTSNPNQGVPAEAFVRHVSHYRLAMEMTIRYKIIRDERISKLLNVATKYMRQYRQYTVLKLEKDYAKLAQDAASSGIYLTEAKFHQLADDIEVLTNEAPSDLSSSVWANNVASMIPRHRVSRVKIALNLLYKEFQMKRYAEDEVSYLWWLTWRNLKYVLATASSLRLLPITTEARDLTASFVEQHTSQIQSIVNKGNDALYQKEIERMVEEFCRYIDNFVQAEGEEADCTYPQFSSLSRSKPVPFMFLTSLEEALLNQDSKPTNGSQVISHRVVKRLNHIMEGPKAFDRWVVAITGDIVVYSATRTARGEKAVLSGKQGFGYGGADRPGASHTSKDPSQSLATGAGTGADGDGDGSDDGKGHDKRGPACDDDETASDSSDEDEEEDATLEDTAHKAKSSKRKRSRSSVTPETLTKAKIDGLLHRTREAHDAAVAAAATSAGPDIDAEDEDHDITSEVPPPAPTGSEHHRQRLEALRTEQRSAVSNAQYPIPETAASQRAVALQISREMADPGVLTEGPRSEDVQPHVDPALRLPVSEDSNQVPPLGPSGIRDTLRSIREVFNRPRLNASLSSSHRPARPVPTVPESDAQRARVARENHEASRAPLQRQPDKFSISKSKSPESKRRRSIGGLRTKPGYESFTSGSELAMPWTSGQKQGDDLDRTTEQSTQTASTARAVSARSPSREANGENQYRSAGPSPHSSRKENQPSPADSSCHDSNKENQSPPAGSSAYDSNKENQSPEVNVNDPDDWTSPSPPHEHDGNLYLRSPMRSPYTPTPAERPERRRHHALPPSNQEAASVWWNDPFEGTRWGQQRPAAAWADPPAEVGQGQGPPCPSNTDGNNARQEPNSNGSSSVPLNSPNRPWLWRPNSTTGLPERVSNNHSGRGNQGTAGSLAAGRPIVVQDPLNPSRMIVNPEFGPDILRLIGGWRVHGNRQIDISIPQGWNVNIETTAPADNRRSMGPSRPEHQHPPGEQPGIQSLNQPRVAPPNRGLRPGSNAPPSLGLLNAWLHQQGQAGSFEEVHEQHQSSTPRRLPRQTRRFGNRVIAETDASPSQQVRDGTSSTRANTLYNKDQEEASPPQSPNWNSRTVEQLRAELSRRGISLRGLRLKQHMINRLRRDDLDQRAQDEAQRQQQRRQQRRRQRQGTNGQEVVIAETQLDPIQQQQQPAPPTRQEVKDKDDSSDSDEDGILQPTSRRKRYIKQQRSSQSQSQSQTSDPPTGNDSGKKKRKRRRTASAQPYRKGTDDDSDDDDDDDGDDYIVVAAAVDGPGPGPGPGTKSDGDGDGDGDGGVAARVKRRRRN